MRRALSTVHRELAVRRRAEHVEAFDAQGAVDRPSLIRIPQLDVAVEGDVGAGPGPGRVVGEPREAVGAGDEALRRIRTDVPRRPLAGANREALVPPFGAPGQMDHVGGGVGDVEVEVDLCLPVEPGIEVARGGRPERGVDGIEDAEVRLVGAVAGARVPGQAVGRGPAHPGDRRHVGDHPGERRGEAARRDLLKGEAVRVGSHLRQGRRVRPVVGNRHRGTVRRAVADAVERVERVADEERPAAVEAEDVGARIGIPEVEPLRRRPAGVVGVSVELQPVGVQVAEVAEQLQVVLDGRVAPYLRRVLDRGVAGRSDRRGVGALHAPARGVGVAVLEAEVGEAGLAERQSDVAGDVVRVAVARTVRTVTARSCPARWSALPCHVPCAGSSRKRAAAGCSWQLYIDHCPKCRC